MMIACVASIVILSSHETRMDANSKDDPGLEIAPRRPVTPAPYSIYLTFDDGPTEGSRFVTDLSLRDSIRLNVFVVGGNVFRNGRNRTLLQAYIDDPFIEIGNHSFTHAEQHYRRYFRRPDLVLADFDRNRDSLHLNNGLARLPGRNVFRIDGLTRDDPEDAREAADTLAAKGYRVFGWDLEWRQKAAEGVEAHTGSEMFSVAQGMLGGGKTFRPNQIVLLLHDREMRDSAFRAQLDSFINMARRDGRFAFRRLSEYETPGDGRTDRVRPL